MQVGHGQRSSSFACYTRTVIAMHHKSAATGWIEPQGNTLTYNLAMMFKNDSSKLNLARVACLYYDDMAMQSSKQRRMIEYERWRRRMQPQHARTVLDQK